MIKPKSPPDWVYCVNGEYIYPIKRKGDAMTGKWMPAAGDTHYEVLDENNETVLSNLATFELAKSIADEHNNTLESGLWHCCNCKKPLVSPDWFCDKETLDRYCAWCWKQKTTPKTPLGEQVWAAKELGDEEWDINANGGKGRWVAMVYNKEDRDTILGIPALVKACQKITDIFEKGADRHYDAIYAALEAMGVK